MIKMYILVLTIFVAGSVKSFGSALPKAAIKSPSDARKFFIEEARKYQLRTPEENEMIAAQRYVQEHEGVAKAIDELRSKQLTEPQQQELEKSTKDFTSELVKSRNAFEKLRAIGNMKVHIEWISQGCQPCESIVVHDPERISEVRFHLSKKKKCAIQ